MKFYLNGLIRATWLMLPAILLVLAVSIANGQTQSSGATQEDVASVTNPTASSAAKANVPLFEDYRGVSIGMSAKEVRSILERVKEGKSQDIVVFSERESAQIFYDDQGNVMAISIDYFGNDKKAPTPETVLGTSLEPKPDGSMYRLNRYPDAGFWVSYNRTAGDKPIVTITMQKM